MARFWPTLGALAAVTIAVFWQVGRHEFVNYDDYAYVTLNRQVQGGLTWEGVAWAFGRLHGEATYWHPLTWLSHMLDCQLFGLNPTGHHLVNLLFHTLNTLLLFILWQRMTGKLERSALVAALFALHPLQVDSVAWVAERKNVLSTCFWMLTLLAYVRYTARPHWTRYAPVMALMALGLMAKPVLVTLPCVMLLLDFWPLGRLELGGQTAHADARKSPRAPPGDPRPRRSFGWLLLEKLPLLVLSAASSWLTLRAHAALGDLVPAGQLPWPARLAHAAVAYALYLRKVIWPADLSVFYLHPGRWPAAAVLGSALVLLGLTALALWRWKQRPYLLVGWAWFLGALVPTIGLVQADVQALADRFAYVPVIGLFVVMVWGAADLSTRWARRRLVLPGAGGLVLLGCVAATSLQLRHWQNSLTLLEHALRLAPENAITHVMLGNAFFERGRLDEALSHYQEALRLRRDYAEPWQRAGVVLSQQQRTVEAIQHFRTAIQLAPAWPEPRRSLALALVGQGHTQEARAEYQAIAALLPADAEGRTKLAEMLAEGQQWADAARVYQEALRLDPDFSPALNNLAWLRATCPQAEFRAGPEAIRLAERACQLTRRNPYFVGALAAAYAEAGRYAEAIQAVQEAHGLARAAGATNLLPFHAQMLSRFQAGKPFHEGEP